MVEGTEFRSLGPLLDSNAPQRLHRWGAFLLVDDTGIEPVTSSVSGKRSPAELIVREPIEVETGFEPVYAALQAAASPLGHSTAGRSRLAGLRADDGVRTRDLHLGKVTRYQLRYVRLCFLLRFANPRRQRREL
jgi:hypothetical protein